MNDIEPEAYKIENLMEITGLTKEQIRKIIKYNIFPKITVGTRTYIMPKLQVIDISFRSIHRRRS